jgi:cysteine synthase B
LYGDRLQCGVQFAQTPHDADESSGCSQARDEVRDASGGLLPDFVGVTRRLRELNPALKAVAVQPESPLHGLEGLKHLGTAVTPGIYDGSLASETLEVSTEDALLMTSRLAREEGLFVGPSSGANVFAAWRLAASLRSPALVVTVLCDGGDRYL